MAPEMQVKHGVCEGPCVSAKEPGQRPVGKCIEWSEITRGKCGRGPGDRQAVMWAGLATRHRSAAPGRPSFHRMDARMLEPDESQLALEAERQNGISL